MQSSDGKYVGTSCPFDQLDSGDPEAPDANPLCHLGPPTNVAAFLGEFG
jgi:hypothetical protein